MLGQAQGLAGQYFAAASFENQSCWRWTRERWKAGSMKTSNFNSSGQYIDDLLRTKKHVLSSEVEAVLGLLSDPLGRIEGIQRRADRYGHDIRRRGRQRRRGTAPGAEHTRQAAGR